MRPHLFVGLTGRQEREERAKQSLFKGLRFFLAREVPLSWVHFVITSFGGEVCRNSLNYDISFIPCMRRGVDGP